MKRRLYVFIFVILLLVFSVLLVACNNGSPVQADKRITVTIMDGEHYSVIGENKQIVERGESVTFTVTLERGYKIVGAYGDKCKISEELSFQQTVTFDAVYHKSTVRLETAEMEKATFIIENSLQIGNVSVSSVLGQVEENVYYADDILNVTATPNDNYRFLCWSKNDYLNSSGEFVAYNETLEITDIKSMGKLYANFKSRSDTGNMIIYRVGEGREIEQDVTQLLASHPRANTYTAVDLRNLGVDCDSRYLAGYTTESGEYVGLGSRVSVSDKTATILTPIWKEYTDSNLFDINQGRISLKTPFPQLDEIVVPKVVNGETVTTICRNAFANCSSSTFYIPDSVTTVEDDAFKDCEKLTDLYMSDSIMNINDAAFSGCKNFTTLHLNAYLKPRHSVDQASVKTDVYDRLLISAEKQDVTRLVILGGSSVNYGYSIATAEKICHDQLGNSNIEVFNLGFNATYSEMAQFEILNKYLKKGDIFLHAPEQYNTAWCGNTMQSPITSSNSVRLSDGYYIFRLTECNWQFLSSLTVNKYGNLFSLFSAFNKVRAGSAEHAYSDHYNFDPVPELLPIGEIAKPECGEDKYFYGGDINFDVYDSVELAKQNIYSAAISKGVHTFVTFPPLNRQKLMLMYDSENQLQEAVGEYTARVKSILSDVSLNVLLTQYDTVYNGRHFSDNDYHLGSPFKNTHTEKVISALISVMQSEGKI